MRNIFFILAVGIFSLSSCKQSTEKATKTEENKLLRPDERPIEEKKHFTSKQLITNMTKVTPQQVPTMKKAALPILQYRWKESNKKSFIALDSGLYEFEFVFSGKEMSKPGQLKGYWIDYHEDLTYDYGYFEADLGSGKYHYNPDTGLLLMVDDADDIKPREMEIKLFSNLMIMDGNEIYKDNNFNAKLLKVQTKPVKS